MFSTESVVNRDRSNRGPRTKCMFTTDSVEKSHRGSNGAHQGPTFPPPASRAVLRAEHSDRAGSQAITGIGRGRPAGLWLFAVSHELAPCG